ncbi:ankyrin repeat domain-containing protein 13C-like [Dioscorea cayenensis subsp. rotundata]|uniref:Ankyrin repeat domain-containing protein 13C-like n=1 Tax=Dioscorea cayennensis subsp. rotundata TaxID=55577 RepID=A0AB40CL46_DIOCR|nr:ankyrin repeat domain-containing protein 13C-like [Dioscorea cayenensis subsp. rotundata]
MEERIRAEDYAHSPAHYAVALADKNRLSRFLATLPRLAPPSAILTESDSTRESHLADLVSTALDRRDVPRRDTPLHLAVRLNLPAAVSSLAAAGADPSLQNAAGWTPLQEAISLRRRPLALILLRQHRLSALSKLRRRLPALLSALRRLPDFYLELSLRLDSPLLPFLPRDSLRLWKRSGDLRADSALPSFTSSLRPRRHPLSFLFLASPPTPHPPGSLLVLDRSKKQIRNAFEGADSLDPSPDDADLIADASAYRPGLDVTKAELIPRTNWRGREKTETVGEWKTRVYDVHNVVFSFKTLKPVDGSDDPEILPLDLDEEDGFLVAEIPDLPARHSCSDLGSRGKKMEISGRRSVDISRERMRVGREMVTMAAARGKEKEMVKSLRPSLWLTEDFPLKTEEFLPLLDILSSKVKAVRRLRELLTAKLPPGTFPVKVAIPIVPTVRLVLTFNKFTYLQPSEEFFTPLSSPRHLSLPEDEEHQKTETGRYKSSWLNWHSNSTPKTSTPSPKVSHSSQVVDNVDPFSIPSEYTWLSSAPKSQRMMKSQSKKGLRNEAL